MQNTTKKMMGHNSLRISPLDFVIVFPRIAGHSTSLRALCGFGNSYRRGIDYFDAPVRAAGIRREGAVTPPSLPGSPLGIVACQNR
jgi:hypothetical protein